MALDTERLPRRLTWRPRPFPDALQRLVDFSPRVLFPSHGPIPTGTDAALANALRRAQLLVNDPDGAVWYGARRTFAYALVIRGGMPVDTVESYLHDRAWLTDGLLPPPHAWPVARPAPAART